MIDYKELLYKYIQMVRAEGSSTFIDISSEYIGLFTQEEVDILNEIDNEVRQHLIDSLDNDGDEL